MCSGGLQHAGTGKWVRVMGSLGSLSHKERHLAVQFHRVVVLQAG